jgi:hypothetical protein
MRPGWNPTRRNRNLGTAKRGRGQDNRLVIPCRGPDYAPFWGVLSEFRCVAREVAGRPFRVLVEPTRPGCAHSCTVDDLFEVLRRVPAPDLSGLGLLILRQPKRKEQILSPCWGRLCYHVEIGEHRGPAILLEAIEPSRPVRWSRSLDPQAAAELERLRQDGHVIRTSRHGYRIEASLDSARAVQLYRTLLHEIGHWVDYLRSVERPAAGSPGTWFALREGYWQRPSAEREAFAHRYAGELRRRLASAGHLPFPRLVAEQGMRRDGLRAEDFLIQPGAKPPTP